MDKDPCKTREESLLEIYRRLRPGEPPTVESSESYLDALFFDARRYDVSKVGRYKFNKKLDIWSRLSGQVLAQPVTDPMTGEIIAMNGETVNARQGARDLPPRRQPRRHRRERPRGRRILQRHGRHGDSSSTLTRHSTASRRRSPSAFCARCSRPFPPTAGKRPSRPAATTSFRSTSPRTISLPPSTTCAAWCRAPARRTTSTIWATAVCAAWASCCRTSSASASPASSASSVSA